MSYVAALGFAADAAGPLPGGWCIDPHATKYTSAGRLGCFCDPGYACTQQPEDSVYGCAGDCVASAQSSGGAALTLAEQVCKEAGLTWSNGLCTGPAPGPTAQPSSSPAAPSASSAQAQSPIVQASAAPAALSPWLIAAGAGALVLLAVVARSA